MFGCSVCSRYVNSSGSAFLMTESPQYQTSENHRKSRSSFKTNTRRSDGKCLFYKLAMKRHKESPNNVYCGDLLVFFVFVFSSLGMSLKQLIAVSLKQATRYPSLNAHNVGQHSRAIVCARCSCSMKLSV